MEKVLLYTQKVDVVLLGTMSHMIMSDTRKATCANKRGEDVNYRKVYLSSRDVSSHKIK